MRPFLLALILAALAGCPPAPVPAPDAGPAYPYISPEELRRLDALP